MQYGKLLLNKVIDDNDVMALTRHNITESDMPTDVDRNTLRFITEYAEDNGGKAPSYATVAAEVEGFEYVPEVSDSFKWLTAQIKDHAAQQAVVDWFQTGEFERKLNELGGKEFVESWLPNALESVKLRTSVRDKVGTDVKTDGEKFLEEYDRRKEGKSFRLWKSRFSSIGEYISSNLYVVYGKSGRGKSVITLEEGVYAAQQGANVLLYAMEMGLYEVMVRIYVSLSGKTGVTTAEIHGEHMTAGFDSTDMRLGRLSEEFEKAFRIFVATINEHMEGNITVRAVDDEDFADRSIRALEADMDEVDADFVIIDPFYYMTYEKNTSKTAGGDASNTSMKLRALAGRSSAVIIAITQADETKEDKDEEGGRELALPNREDVKKTKSLLEDAYQLIGVDTDYKQGRGLVGVSKGRSGGEGNVSEILYIPQVGIVKEIDVGSAALSGFNF